MKKKDWRLRVYSYLVFIELIQSLSFDFFDSIKFASGYVLCLIYLSILLAFEI